MVVLFAAGAAHALEILPHSFSRSKQFVIYARESAVRGAVGTLAEEAKSGLLNALGLQDEWRLPIVVDLRAPDPGLADVRPPVRLTVAQTGAGLKIELDLLTGEAGRGTRLRDEIVRTLLLELSYRELNGLPAGRSCTLPPPWLVEGFSAYLENLEDGVSASMFEALLPTSQTLSITEFLARDPSTMDSTSHAVYRAYAYNLVSLLVRDLEGGRAGMMAFIRDLPTMPPEEARSAGVLSQHFPQLAASPDGLEKWWTLGLARLASADRYQGYTVEETEQRLQPLLSFAGPVDLKKPGITKTYSIADYQEFTPLKVSSRILEPTRRGLIELSGRANALSRPIVTGYQEVVEALARHRTKGVSEHLQVLAVERKEVLKLREDIADYMNWFEATQMPIQSGAFEEYFRASHQLAAGRRVHRPDPISAYLDALDVEFR